MGIRNYKRTVSEPKSLDCIQRYCFLPVDGIWKPSDFTGRWFDVVSIWRADIETNDNKTITNDCHAFTQFSNIFLLVICFVSEFWTRPFEYEVYKEGTVVCTHVKSSERVSTGY